MTVKLGLLALLEAKPEKGGELAAFLEGGRSIAAAEEGTVTWYTFKISDTSYGIFDTFESEDARHDHLNGDPACTRTGCCGLITPESPTSALLRSSRANSPFPECTIIKAPTSDVSLRNAAPRALGEAHPPAAG